MDEKRVASTDDDDEEAEGLRAAAAARAVFERPLVSITFICLLQ
jgi:hypothetical protein